MPYQCKPNEILVGGLKANDLGWYEGCNMIYRLVADHCPALQHRCIILAAYDIEPTQCLVSMPTLEDATWFRLMWPTDQDLWSHILDK